MHRRTALKGFVASALATDLFATGRASAMTARHHQVKILKFKFDPTVLDVKPGDQITWTNYDIVPHTASATDGSWDTGHLDKDASRTITVSSEMAGTYFCQYHPSMKASLKLV